MFTRRALETHKLTAKDFRQVFDTNVRSEKAEALVRRWAARAQAGRQWNLRHYRHFLALDRAWEVGFRQTTQTLIGVVKDLSMVSSEEDAVSVAKNWKMTHLLVEDINPTTKQPTGRKRLSLPILWDITLSLPRAYTLQRTSDLANQRLQTPLIPFEPAFPTMKEKAKCDVLTARAEQMAREFGYDQSFRQFIQKTAIYGHQLVFPNEEWYEREDWTDEGSQPGRDGVRLCGPPAIRSYWDMDYPMWTLNTGTGSRFAGYWRTRKWGDVRADRTLWNLDKVKKGSKELGEEWAHFANTTGQCVISGYPVCDVSQLDREKAIAEQYYSNHQDDAPVFITEHFEMINPKYDLDESKPDTNLWVRAVLANDDAPLYVGPMNDRAVSAFMWEPLDNLQLQVGLLLEFIPYGDHCSNLISQGLVAIYENMRRLIIYNKTHVADDDIRGLKNPNQGLLQQAAWLGFTQLEMESGNFSIRDLFHNVSFEKANVAEHLNMIGQLLGLMERIGGITAQDVGGHATHEQSAREIEYMRSGTSQRKAMQGFDMDRGLEAIRGVIYAQAMNNGQDSARAFFDAGFPRETLEQLGFTVEEEDQRGMIVKAPMNMLRVEQFASRRESRPSPYMAMGQQMVQLVGQLLASPKLNIPNEQFIQLVNYTLEMLGMPKDFRVEPTPVTDPPDVRDWVMQTLKQFEGDFRTMVTDEQRKMLTQLVGAQNGMQTALQMPQQPMAAVA